jgi:hypothetical protein
MDGSTNRLHVTHKEDKHPKDYLSCSLLVRCGVPQGFVLEPVLFVIYFSNFPDLKRDKTIVYVDDT